MNEPTRPPDAPPEDTAHLKQLLRDWVELEERGIRSLQKLRTQTKNRLLRQVLSVMMHDSVQHRRVQEVLLDALDQGVPGVAPEEIDQIWSAIRAHDELELASIEKARAAREASGSPIVRYLLGYLETDERKHHQMLEDLEEVKRHRHP